MMIVVDPGVPLPVYEQIREQVVRLVASGTLGPGHRLPSIRQLASDLGLAKGTVARAYELLDAESVIETRGRSGSFVVESPAVSGADRTVALDAAAEALVVIARQVGVEIDSVRRALDEAWARI